MIKLTGMTIDDEAMDDDLDLIDESEGDGGDEAFARLVRMRREMREALRRMEEDARRMTRKVGPEEDPGNAVDPDAPLPEPEEKDERTNREKFEDRMEERDQEKWLRQYGRETTNQDEYEDRMEERKREKWLRENGEEIYLCSQCESNEVDSEGDICDSCYEANEGGDEES